MGIWIRSQDKKRLINSDVFAIEEKRYFQKINGRYTIHIDNEKNIHTDWKILANNLTVGIYSTKEKALKVLDEIQECIEANNSHHNSQWDNTPHLVYNVFQMPQDDEVE